VMDSATSPPWTAIVEGPCLADLAMGLVRRRYFNNAIDNRTIR
jgi:hypothetical protein